MKLQNPEFLLLFIPLILVYIYNSKWGVKKRSRLTFPHSNWRKSIPKTRITPFKIGQYLRIAALGLAIFALARPVEFRKIEKRYVEAVDMIICFDLSKSMDALDFKPNRRNVALNTISYFIDQRKDDRIGLVLFSGEAYMAVPLTTDHEFLRKGLFESTGLNMQDGTAIGQALAVGVNHLKDSEAKSRVIVLVTDGDNNMGSVDPVTAAELARGFGLKVYTIAIGKKGRVPYPVKSKDAFGREVEVLNYLTDAVDEELLKKIATNTGGQFFRASDGNVLEEIFDTIDKLEKTKVETNSYTESSEHFLNWLLAALCLLFLEAFLLNTRWRKIP